MKYLVLVSHGEFAAGLKTALAMFAGDKIDQVIAVGLADGKSADDFGVEFRNALSGINDDDSLVVLADIVGGSPLTTAIGVLDDLGRLNTTPIIGGMNLPMALIAVVMKDALEGDAFVQAVIGEASAAIQQFKPAAEEADDEDDI